MAVIIFCKVNYYQVSIEKEDMPQVALNCPAPDFQLADFNGKLVRLSDQIGKTNVLLVFNRGFV